jgi:hypothetical protein
MSGYLEVGGWLEGIWCVCVIVTGLFVVVEEGGEYGQVGGKC